MPDPSEPIPSRPGLDGWVETCVQRQRGQPDEPMAPPLLRITRRAEGPQPQQIYRNDCY